MVLLDLATASGNEDLNSVIITIGSIVMIGLVSMIWYIIKKYISNQEGINKDLKDTLNGVKDVVSEFKLIANEVQHAQKDIGRVEKDYKDHINIFHVPDKKR